MQALIEIVAGWERCLDYFATYNTVKLRVSFRQTVGSVRMLLEDLSSFKNRILKRKWNCNGCIEMNMYFVTF